MNMFGFIATIVICATFFGTMLLLTKKVITIKHVHINITENKNNTPIQLSQEDKDKIEEELNKHNVAAMDAVIKAANEMMGITTAGGDRDVE